MSLPFPTLKELSMRAVLVKELPWEKELIGLPMKQELEALNRLPGNYTVTKSSYEVNKAGGGVLDQWEAEYVENVVKLWSTEVGNKVSILKELCGDPVVLWRIVLSTEARELRFPIEAQPVQQNTLNLFSLKCTNLISGVKVEKEACYKGRVEVEKIYTTREGKVVKSHSFCCVVNSKGKLEVVVKVWTTFENDDAEVEVVTTWEAQRD